MTPMRIHVCGSALPVAVGLGAVVVTMIAISTTGAVSTQGQQRRFVDGSGALAAVDAVLACREGRLRAMAQTGSADEFIGWRNFEFDYTGDGTQSGVPTGKNYGEDIVGQYRVRWKIEPMVVESPDQTDSNGRRKFITNPAPTSATSALPGSNTAWQQNDTKFLYRLSAEAVLFENPDDPELNAPSESFDSKANAVLARAQGVRFVSASNVPLFRYVIFYAQKGPKGDLELTHGGNVTIAGDVHSNGAIYLGGDTKAMSWLAMSSSSITRLGTSTVTGPNSDGVRVYGVDGIFNLSKASMYGAFNFPGFMTPVDAANLTWTPAGKYETAAGMPGSGAAFPLDASPFYAPLGSPHFGTSNGTLINPYRIKDESGLVTTDANRTINGVVLRGSTGSSVATDANDARDAFRLAAGGSTWVSASSNQFFGFARTAETGGREVKLDASLLGRPLEPQALFYPNFSHTQHVDESQLEEYALPRFQAPAGGPLATAAPAVVEIPGYYLAKAMGAASESNASVTRYPGSATDSSVPKAMTGWTLDAGPGAATKVGLIIRERYRPDFLRWGAGTGAVVVPSNHPEFKPYAYGKHYRPVSLAGFLPVFFGQPNFAQTNNNHLVNLSPALTDIAYSGGLLTVKASTAYGNTSNLGTTFTDTCFTSNPRAMVHIGTEPVKWNEFSSVVVRIDNVSGPSTQQVGLAIHPGQFNGTVPGASRITSGVNTSETVLTLDSVEGLSPSSFLTLNGTELVRIRRVGPDSASPRLTELQIEVARGAFGSTASAAPAGAPVKFTSTLPVACRLTSDITTATQTTFDVDDASLLSVNDTLRLLTDVVRITAITGNQLTVVRGAADGGNSTGFQYPIAANAPLHWAERSPYLMVGYSPMRGFFLQRRERPAQYHSDTDVWWSGNGQAGNGRNPGVFELANAPRQDVSIPLARVRLTQGIDSGQDVQGTSTTVYSNNPNAEANIIWTNEGSTINVSDFGTRVVTTTRYVRSWMRWYVEATLNGNVPANLGFWDPTPNVSGDVGDRGRRLALFAGLDVNPTLRSNIVSLSSQFTPNSLRMYARARIESDVTRFPTQAPPVPNELGANDTRYDNSTAALSSKAWRRVTQGVFDNRVGGDITYWGDPATLGITLPFTIPSGTYAGRRLVAPPDDDQEDMADPGAAPTWNRPGGADPSMPLSPFAAVTGSGTAFQGAVTGTPYAVPTPVGFAVDRTAQRMDTNPYVTASGNFGFGATEPLGPTPMVLPRSNWGTPPLTWSFRPDAWHGPTAYSATNTPPGATAAATGVWVNATTRMSDDIYSDSLVANPEKWVGIARVDSSGNVSTNPAHTKVRFYYYSGSARPNFPSDFSVMNHPNGRPVEADLAVLVRRTPRRVAAADDTPLLIGPLVNSGSLGSPTEAKFTDYTLTRTSGQAVTFSGASGDLASQYSQYLASQYQVWWGTKEITSDFFSWNQGDDRLRLATEDWFYQPREFWSQSRWWNEEVQAPTALGGTLTDRVATATYPYPTNKNLLVEKDVTSHPGSGISANNDNLARTENRMLFAKTTVLTLNVRQVQDYIKSRRLAEATEDASDSGGSLLSQSFNGLIYVARTNRAPFVPDLNRLLPSTLPTGWPTTGIFGRGRIFEPTSNAWISSMFEFGSALTSGSSEATTWSFSSDPDNYDNFVTNPPYDPYTRGATVYLGSGTGVAGTIGMGAVPSLDLAGTATRSAVRDDAARDLVPNVAPYNSMVTPRLRPSEFHHGVRLINGSSIDWGYGQGTPMFGATKLSIVTPNQLYVQGNFNSETRTVQLPDGTTTSRVAPVAVMGDVVTLLSNSFRDAVYQVPGLSVSSRNVTGGGILATPNGATASTTTYNTCILTHNMPTSKATSRFGEASSFVNTMMFLENWVGKSMNFTGSLVVMNTRRYSQGFLLEQPKVFGRTPFGWAGWNARSTSGGTTPATPTASLPYGTSFNSGSGYLDWCSVSTSDANRVAGGAGELLPFDYPSGQANGRTIAASSDGIPPVYRQPNRNLTFNPDLKTEEGTPPFTPYGNDMAGLGAWSRIVQ